MTLMSATRYDLTTGRILGRGYVDDELPPPVEEGRIPGEYDPDTEYYNLLLGSVGKRGPLETEIDNTVISLGQSVTLTLLPVPCEVLVSGMGYITVDDGVLVLTPQSVGEYSVVIDMPTTLRTQFQFEVTE